MLPDYWTQACKELSRRDKVISRLIDTYPESYLKSKGKPFETLVRAIIGQQISVKAADAIWARLTAYTCIDAQCIAEIDCDTLRQLGLSQRKAQYIHAVCAYFIDHHLHDEYFTRRTDQEVLKELTAIRGIGKWSAEMFLMFTLQRPNVFPVDDIGLLRALSLHYQHSERLTPAQARKLYCHRFSPWCSVATWFLWRSLDPMEIQY